jgi:transglutaminase-like putative cysteine protease
LSAVATRPPPLPKSSPAGEAGGPPGDAVGRDALGVRLAAFAALGLFGAGHWAGLVTDPPVGRILLPLAIAVAGAAGLGLLPRLHLSRAATTALATAAALVMLVAALGAAGLAPRLLLPSGWAELGDGLDRGLSGISSVDWPYRGGEHWVRLTILLGPPLLLAAAAALAFWPARRGASALRAAALVLLLLLYGTAVTNHDPGQPALRGLVLLALVAAWLWLPRLEPREALAGAGLVLAVGIFALPLAAKLDADRPWWDYRSWDWFGNSKNVTFNWNHEYGPLDWPREGTTLLNVKSARAHYWKAETLDRFDGYRWLRSVDNDGTRPFAELPGSSSARGTTWEYFEWNPRWDVRFRVTVRSLSSSLIVGAGTTYSVRGVGPAAETADGTTVKLEDPLKKGDSYTVRAYAPDPTATQMRGAPRGFPTNVLQYTGIFLPGGGGNPYLRQREPTRRDRPSLAGRPGAIFMPSRGEGLTGSPGAREQLLASPYARVYRLARRVTAGQPTTYDAVKAVEDHLQRSYSYSENPPARQLPLVAFLFQDKVGYCQQFSGAMALMLRMMGIPSRVVTGFSPGSYNRDTKEYRVRDLDAHSWVEVYFTGIGWVPFDPTPTAAPATAQSSGLGATSAAAGDGGEVNQRAQRSEQRGGGNQPSTRGSSDGFELAWWMAPAGLVLLAGATAGGIVVRDSRRRHRALGALDAADSQIRELEQALVRLGWRLPPGTTLLALERRLARAAGPGAARYVAKLRAHRFGLRKPSGPGPADRRALRRELSAAGGLRERLLGLLAIPPGGPRPL